MAFRRLPTSCILEVERKFRSLAVPKLTQYGGLPHFKSLKKLPIEIIHDSYYDKSNLLSSAGVWIRKRDEKWEAKVKKGGSFTNSRFEELNHVDDISACIKNITGIHDRAARNFGLDPTAIFSTTRETWIADDEFHVVLDTTDFGHQVGEVELQKVLADEPTEQQKQIEVQAMDERVAGFMETYAWAFSPGLPKGKLTAYFELQRDNTA